MKGRILASGVLFCCVSLAVQAAITIDPPSRSFAKEGGGASVLTSGSGSWTATTASAWITITPRTNGVAGESCVYVVAANFSADTRQGVIVIAGQNHTVTQSGYDATLSPTSAVVTLDGGSGEISVTTAAGVSWNAVSHAAWVTVVPTSGVSAGTVTYTVARYGGVTDRSASLTIAGKTFTIKQTGADVNISPPTVEKTYEADIVQVQVTALFSTTWSVTPNASWISVVDGGSGSGDSSVTLGVGTNPSYQHRVGTVSIGSATLTITQEGTPNPVLAITPTETTASPLGATGGFAVLATPDAPWSVTSLDSWLIVSEGHSGAGNGNVSYVVTANPNLTSRVGRIRIDPPVYQARSDLSWLLFAHINNSSNDVSGWSRHLSGSLSQIFNGTNPLNMTGQDFYRNDDAFSIAFWFRVDEIGAINRLLEVTRAASSYSTIYIDGQNRLVFLSNGESLVTDLAVEASAWYQVLVAADSENTVSIYAGKRSGDIFSVGSRSFSAAPFPRNYVTPARIRIGGAVQPSSGNLNSGRIDDLRFYGRALSAYESTKLLQYAGTSTPYGPFSHKGDASNVCVEYNLQGQSLVAGGIRPPTNFTQGLVQFHVLGNLRDATERVRHTMTLYGQLVEEVRGTGQGWYDDYNNVSRRIYWRYQFVYVDGTQVYTTERSALAPAGYTEANPYPNRKVAEIRVLARTDSGMGDGGSLISYVQLRDAELRRISRWHLGEDRFAVRQRSLVGDTNSFVVLQNHQSSFDSASATYNFWMRFDDFPSSGATRIFRRGVNEVEAPPVFACSLLSGGQLQFSRDGNYRNYDANLQAGQWYMISIAGTQNGVARFFVDGEEIGNTSDFGDYVYGSSGATRHSLVIGGWNGAIDYAGFYDGALSSAQIRAIYEAQKPQTLYHTVSQGVVIPSITPTSAALPPAGGTASTELTLAANVNWSASTGTGWLQITSPTSGMGSATINVLAAANPTVYERQGTVIIAGKMFTITQAGLNSSVSYEDPIFGTDGGSAWVDVSAEGGGQWQAVSQVPWLTVAIGSSGSGAGSVFIVADPYNDTSGSRIGTVIIAGHIVYFTQRGYELTVSPQVAQIGSNAQAGEFGVAAPISAVWESIATHPWITIVGGNTGLGNGTVYYTVTANDTGLPRTGRIIVAGEEYTITQLTSLLLTALSSGNGSVSGGGSYETLANATLTPHPDEEYLFSHWTGDAVGNANPLIVSMDSSKTITAHFIAEDLADSIAFGSMTRLGLHTTDEMRDMAMGMPLIEVDPETGRISLWIGLEEATSLLEGDWSDMPINADDVQVQDGKVRVDVGGEASFYRLTGGATE